VSGCWWLFLWVVFFCLFVCGGWFFFFVFSFVLFLGFFLFLV